MFFLSVLQTEYTATYPELKPKYISGYFSDYYDCQSAAIYSNYMNVTIEHRTNNSKVTLTEKQSADIKVSCYGDTAGYIMNDILYLFHKNVKSTFTDVAEGDTFQIYRNSLLVRNKYKIKLYKLTIGAEIVAEKLIEVPPTKSMFLKDKFAYQQNETLIVFDYYKNETVAELSLEKETLVEPTGFMNTDYLATIHENDVKMYQFVQEPVISLKLLRTIHIEDFYVLFDVHPGTIPTFNLISAQVIQMYNELYVALYSGYSSIENTNNKYLVLVSAKGVDTYLESPFSPMQVRSDGMQRLYISGRSTSTNSQFGFQDMDGIVKAFDKLTAVVPSCWSIKENLDVQISNQNITIKLTNSTQCDPAQVLAVYRDYFVAEPMKFEDNSYKYVKMARFKQLGFELVIKNTVSRSSTNLFVSETTVPYIEHRPSCFSDTNIIEFKLEANQLKLNLSSPASQDCAVDQPVITVRYEFENRTYSLQMRSVELPDPTLGAMYYGFFSQNIYKGVSGFVKFNFTVQSSTPSGFPLQNVTFTKTIEHSLKLCFYSPSAVSAVYEYNRLSVKAVGQDDKFGFPCINELNLTDSDEKFDLEYEINNIKHFAPRKQFVIDGPMTVFERLSSKDVLGPKANFTYLNETPIQIPTSTKRPSCKYEEDLISIEQEGFEYRIQFGESTACDTQSLPPLSEVRLVWGPGDDDYCSPYKLTESLQMVGWCNYSSPVWLTFQQNIHVQDDNGSVIEIEEQLIYRKRVRKIEKPFDSPGLALGLFLGITGLIYIVCTAVYFYLYQQGLEPEFVQRAFVDPLTLKAEEGDGPDDAAESVAIIEKVKKKKEKKLDQGSLPMPKVK